MGIEQVVEMPPRWGMDLERAWSEHTDLNIRLSDGKGTVPEFAKWLRDCVFYLTGPEDFPPERRREIQRNAALELAEAGLLAGRIKLPAAKRAKWLGPVRFVAQALGQEAVSWASEGFGVDERRVAHLFGMADLASELASNVLDY